MEKKTVEEMCCTDCNIFNCETLDKEFPKF